MHSFEWRVASRYRVTAGALLAEGRTHRVYKPLADEPALHRLFAGHDPDAFSEFASEFGLLGLGTPAEPLREWAGHQSALRTATERVDALAGRVWPGWQRLVPRRVQAELPTGPRFDSACRSWIRSRSRHDLASQLKLWTEPECEVIGNRVIARLNPRNLLGAMWLLVADSLAGERDVVRCLACGVEMGVGAGVDLRIDAKYCSTACRVAAYNRKSRYADSLLREGRTLDAAARLSGLRYQTLRRRRRE